MQGAVSAASCLLALALVAAAASLPAPAPAPARRTRHARHAQHFRSSLHDAQERTLCPFKFRDPDRDANRIPRVVRHADCLPEAECRHRCHHRGHACVQLYEEFHVLYRNASGQYNPEPMAINVGCACMAVEPEPFVKLEGPSY